MARRKLQNRNVRNIQKSRGVYYTTLPIEYVKMLGWRERQKVVIKKRGKKLAIEDWQGKK